MTYMALETMAINNWIDPANSGKITNFLLRCFDLQDPQPPCGMLAVLQSFERYSKFYICLSREILNA